MSDIRITVVSPRGDAFIMEMPDDVPLRDLLPEIAHALHIELPEAPAPRYEMKSLGAGARVEGDETLAALAEKGEVTLRLDMAREIPVRVVSSPPAALPPVESRPEGTVLWRPDRRADEGAEERLPIYLFPEAYEAIRAHTRPDLLHEHGGYLLGKHLLDEGRDYVTVERAFPVPDTKAEPTSFEFSSANGVALFDETERTGLQVVGWYHSHPRMDVFLSGHDLFIHNGYFREPWQVALVVEPEKDQGGFFRWRDGRMDGQRYGGFHEVLRGESLVTWTNVRPSEGE